MGGTRTVPKVGIVGVGWIGAQFKRYFEEVRGHERGKTLFLYDTDITKGYLDDVSLAEVVFMCLPTPRNPRDGSCDTSIVEDGIRRVASENGGKIIVIKSTVTPGTTESFQRKYPEHQFLFSPEFLTESRAWEDMLRPDRQIVGFTEKSLDAANFVLSLLPKAPFMSPWGLNTYTPVRITATEAELIKYAANVYFVRKVNWANALARTAERLGVNYESVRRGMSADHRIGDSHLDVSHGGYRGWGGYCFPKDTAAFMAFTKTHALTDVHTLLAADWFFNESLLREQGLSIEAVSRHSNELPSIVQKKSKGERQE
jgi:UDPglucose 6-dehydrogenase